MEIIDKEQQLYFGSPAQKLNLAKSQGRYFKFKEDLLQQTSTPNSIVKGLLYRFPFKFLGPEYEKLYLPCTPAQEIMLKSYEADFPNVDEKNESFLEKFALIKSPNKSELIGYQSGKRSIVLFWKDNKCQRLKGCGNFLEGFIISKGRVTLDPDSIELRGCHYEPTVKRELLITSKVEKMLNKVGFLCGNRPVGYWHYEENQDFSKMGLKNEMPLIKKYCAVFETLGEKRVASHLMQGLDMLLFCISEKIATIAPQNAENLTNFLKSIVPKERLDFTGSFIDQPLVTTLEFMDFNTPLKEQAKNGFFKPNHKKNLIDLKDLAASNKLQMRFDHLLEVFVDIKKRFNIHQEYVNLYDELITRLLASNEKHKDFLFVLSAIFARIGFEIGVIKRTFLDNDLNWGQYLDHHSYLGHCNAHPNNFIVLPDKYENLIAPLDFDLSQEEKEFININYSEKTYGKFDKELFQRQMREEEIALEDAMAGGENMENFKYNEFKFVTENKTAWNLYKSVQSALRDTLRIGFMEGFNLENLPQHKNEWDGIRNKQIHSAVKLALMITHNFVA